MVSTCGPFRFTSNFDSGNFLKTELVEGRKGHGVDYEVNLWTRPDCYGTAYENGNRTWFHFGIKGGKPAATMKLNILNLNKQVKLFHQGMQPVFRIIPEQPYWQRVPDRLIVNETLDHVCSISFRHKLPDNPNKSTLYIAFSYPFSYAELREWLNRLNNIFGQPLPEGFVFDRVKLPFPKPAENSLVATAALPIEDEIYYYRETACNSVGGRTVDLITVTSLYGMSSEREERLANLFPEESTPRPYRFPCKKVVFLSARVHPGETPSQFVLNGFFKFVLERNDPRAILLRRLFVFKFIPMLNPDGVARGHYRTDPRGVNLNRVYLNPSPVLHPSIYAARKLLLYYHYGRDIADDYEYPTEEQPCPSISAAASDLKSACQSKDSNSLLSQLQQEDSLASSMGGGSDTCASNNGNDVTEDSVECSGVPGAAASKVNMVDSKVSGSVLTDGNSGVGGGENSKSMFGSTSKYTFVLSDANSLCAGCTIAPFEKSKKIKGEGRRSDSGGKMKKKKRRKSSRSGSDIHKKSSQDLSTNKDSVSSASSSRVLKSEETTRLLIENEMDSLVGPVELLEPVTMENVDMETDSHQCAFEACDEDSVLYTSDLLSDGSSNNLVPNSECTTPSKAVLSEKKEDAGPSNQLPKSKDSNNKKGSNQSSLETELFGLSVRKRLESPEMKLRDKAFHKDIASTSRSPLKSQNRYTESPSGLFLYVDMHGHATKRGIFMYGNHFPDVATQTECMILPRLMAMNCQHFDFAACNFTERLMNMKDRRDGASREGSGRVACLKLTGLVRSYTLECNYNTGRLVNPVVTRPGSFGFVDPPANINIHHSPKFTPQIFEETGKALAESVLDMSGQNPWSRLSFTEFKSLEGMRRWLCNRLVHTPEYNQARSATTTASSTTKDKLCPKKSSSTGIVVASPSPQLGRSSSTILKSTKKRPPKKRSNSKVLVELHPHRAAVAGSSSKRGSETRVPIISPSGISKNSTTPTRRASLPNRLNCYVVPSGSRASKDASRRDPPAR